MNLEQALQLVNSALFQKMQRYLSDVETLILRGSWHKNTYEAIADSSHYSASYLRKDVGPKLWRDLSAAMDEPVSKTNFRTALERRWQGTTVGQSPQMTCPTREYFAKRKTDWSDAIDVSIFLGRVEERSILTTWLTQDRCRFVILLGMGGIGKTALSIKVGQDNQSDFEVVIWRSLRNAPPLLATLTEVTKFISQTPDIAVPKTEHEAISQQLQYLKEHRCLLILDNVEAILQEGDRSYKPSYEGYGRWFETVGEVQHLSCLMVTSRELPFGLTSKLGQLLPMRSMLLTGLSVTEGQGLLNCIGQFAGSQSEWHSIIAYYAGNPLALKIVASFVSEVFAGNLHQCLQFLGESSFIFDDIRDLLDQQFQRLSPAEKSVMIWLALRRVPSSIQDLRDALTPSLTPHRLLQVMTALQGRSLIDKTKNHFTQQSVVMEYVIRNFIQDILTQLTTWSAGDAIDHLSYLRQYALILIDAKDYVNEIQSRLILRPILEQLLAYFGSASEVVKHFNQILLALKPSSSEVCYGAGNVINFLQELKIDLTGYNFSELSICQANFQGIKLYNADFRQAQLSKCKFSSTFSGIMSIAYSPDGESLVAGDNMGTLHVWHVSSQKYIYTIKAHCSHIMSLDISSDNHWIVSSSADGTIKLWNRNNFEMRYSLQAHSQIIYSVCFSKDNQCFVSCSDDGTIKVWNCLSGACLRVIELESPVRAVTFMADSRFIISGSQDHLIQIWNIETGKCIRAFGEQTQPVWSLALSPSDRWLASGGGSAGETNIRIWETQTGRCLNLLSGHTQIIWNLEFSHDEELLASTSFDCTVRLWQYQEGKCVECLQDHTDWVFGLAFTPDDHKLATGGLDRTIKIWQVSRGHCLKTMMGGYSNTVWAIDFSERLSSNQDQQYIICGNQDNTIKVWDVQTQCWRYFLDHSPIVKSMQMSPDGKSLASGNFCAFPTVKVWDLNTGHIKHSFEGHQNGIHAICFSPDGTLVASGSEDGAINIWSLEEGRCIRTFSNRGAMVWALAFSQDGQTLVSGGLDESVRVWNVTLGQCQHEFQMDNLVMTTLFSRSGKKVIAAGSNTTIRIWDLQTGNCDHILSHENAVMQVINTMEDNQIISGSFDQTIRFWDIQSGHCLKTWKTETQIYSLALSGDGKTLISGDENGVIQRWDITTEQPIEKIILPGIYAGMNIQGVKGLTSAQHSMLMSLGAVSF